MESAVFVTCRTGSSRLPKKALLEIYPEVSCIEHVIRRAKLAVGVNKVVLCTTFLDEDDELCSIASENDVFIYRGSVEDKLERWLGAAKTFGIDVFSTMDGDDLFCCPELVSKSLQQLSDFDFLEAPRIVTGGFTYAMRVSALQEVCRIKDSKETEMMWTYFKDTGKFRIGELSDYNVALEKNDIRLTLDYEEDYELFRILFQRMGSRPDIRLEDVVSFLDLNPYLKGINFFRQEDFLLNQKNKTALKLKEF